jgi:hypothetical protein
MCQAVLRLWCWFSPVHDWNVHDGAGSIQDQRFPLDLLFCLVSHLQCTVLTCRYGIGQLCSSLALKVMNDNDPFNYLTPIYTEWAMLGLMLGVYVFIPESPFWCANTGRHERGRAVIQRLNGGIPGYDVDYHYNIIKRSVEKERAYEVDSGEQSRGFLHELKTIKEVFVGVNGVSLVSEATARLGSDDTLLVPNPHRILACLCSTDRRSRSTLVILVIFRTAGWIRGSIPLQFAPCPGRHRLYPHRSVSYRSHRSSVTVLGRSRDGLGDVYGCRRTGFDA